MKQLSILCSASTLGLLATLVAACTSSPRESSPPAPGGPGPDGGSQACTEEAMVCPDGSAVGRTGPNCTFAPCPGPAKAAAGPSPAEAGECKNECGNGTCEEIVCMAVGCPCAETKASCPQDCK